MPQTMKSKVFRTFRRLTGHSDNLLPTSATRQDSSLQHSKSLGPTNPSSPRRASAVDQNSGYHKNRYPGYYMTPDILKKYLTELFPTETDFKIIMSTDSFEFMTPRALTETEMRDLGRRASESNQQRWLDEESQWEEASTA